MQQNEMTEEALHSQVRGGRGRAPASDLSTDVGVGAGGYTSGRWRPSLLLTEMTCCGMRPSGGHRDERQKECRGKWAPKKGKTRGRFRRWGVVSGREIHFEDLLPVTPS